MKTLVEIYESFSSIKQIKSNEFGKRVVKGFITPDNKIFSIPYSMIHNDAVKMLFKNKIINYDKINGYTGDWVRFGMFPHGVEEVYGVSEEIFFYADVSSEKAKRNLKEMLRNSYENLKDFYKSKIIIDTTSGKRSGVFELNNFVWDG